MRILLIHNYYKDWGGEDTSVDCQETLLKANGIKIISYTKRSSSISGMSEKLRSGIGLTGSKKTYRELDALIKKEKPDIAHLHNLYPLITTSAYDALRDNRIPIVQTLHNYRLFCSNGLCLRHGDICIKCLMNSFGHVFNVCREDNRLYDFLMGLNIYLMRKSGAYGKVDRFIALSKFQKDKIACSGIPRDKIEVIRNICPFTLHRDIYARFLKECKYFTYMGRLSEEKGIFELVKLFRKLPGLNLKILGDGPMFDTIASYILDHNLKNVAMAGYVCGDEKFEILSRTFAVIVPSVCFEVSPVVIPESLAMGIPVIVHNIGSLPENIKHGKNGYIYNDISDLSSILKDLSGFTEDRLRQIYMDCLKSYEELFEPENNLQRLLATYKQLIGKNA